MAVLIEAISVVVRREIVRDRYIGGWPAFVADAPNNTLCADREIARVGFMDSANTHAFVQRLERRGFVHLNEKGVAVDLVVIDQNTGPLTPCPWIECFEQRVPAGFVGAARVVESLDTGVYAPDVWTLASERLRYVPRSELTDKMEYVKDEYGAEAYRDRQTGKEYFIGRPTHLEAGPEGVESDAPSGVHHERLEQARDVLVEFVDTNTRPTTPKEKDSVAMACGILEQLAALFPGNAEIWFWLGTGRRNLGIRPTAYEAFSQAYRLAPNDVEVGRNLAGECLTLGYADEAVDLTGALVKRMPDDAGLIANHAVAWLIKGDCKRAMREVQSALQIAPDDEITLGLKSYVADILAGKATAPTSIQT